MTRLADSLARERAATVMDRNLVVTAGAGTGKTTLLVDRLTHLLFKQPDPIALGSIVALTFTNKAANEMKLRFRDRLAAWMAFDPSAPPSLAARRRDWEQMGDVLKRYALRKDRLDELADAALRELEKSQIGTIHSFAAHLLRLHPQESGVDPEFVEDDGTRFAEHLEQEWGLWLDRELGPAGDGHDAWRAALDLLSLDEIRELAVRLCGELIPLRQVETQLQALAQGATLPPALTRWLASQAERAAALRESHPKVQTLERMLETANSFLKGLAEGRRPAPEDPAMQGLDREAPPPTKDWSKEDHAEAKSILRLCRSLLNSRIEPALPLLERLIGFARDCRRRFVDRGFVSFDGLLARARDLLRDHPEVRRALKAQFQAILVDEFQDTDPVQYEVILYLAEASGSEAATWRDVRLHPSKLFIVGDPKQSIYAFRRADMEAYDVVVDDLILESKTAGERQTLQTNFRSAASLLGPINQCFSRLFPARPVKGLQPGDEPLLPPPDAVPPLATEGIEMRLVRPEEAEADAETATRCEAEEIARWLAEEVIGRQELREGDASSLVRPRHIAILFRTLTYARDYLEALRRHEVPYLTEGEKHFFERQEVIDLANLLRAATDPHDLAALVGVLRSPVGGLTDREIALMAREGALDYRIESAVGPGAARRTYELLRELHRELPRRPAAEAVDFALERGAVLELAAASVDGEQAVANVRKLRDRIVECSARGDLSWTAVVAALRRQILEAPDEAESPLADEAMEDRDDGGAVRVLSIHKAKGLEFPMVILAGLHRGVDRREDKVFVQHDWATGLVGLRVGSCQTVEGAYLMSKLARRQRAEQRRVLYVAMTRAKRRLVLSAGIPGKTGRTGDSFLALVGEGFGRNFLETGPEALESDGHAVRVDVVGGREYPLAGAAGHRRWASSDVNVNELERRWIERTQRHDRVGETPLTVTATSLLDKESWSGPARTGSGEPGSGTKEGEGGKTFGVLAHRVLEGWDFSRGIEQLESRLEALGLSAGEQELVEELRETLRGFVESPIYRELRRAEILGREVPFAMPWEDEGPEARGEELGAKGKERHPQHSALSTQSCILTGALDLLYRLDGRLWIADYKTDRVADGRERAADYGPQARLYKEAVRRALRERDVGFTFIFLRIGKAVQV